METICQRIAWLIDTKCDGNRSKFARSINITPAYAAQLYAGEREPSDRTISDVCRVFGVNKEWLLYGKGKKFLPQSSAETEMIEKFLDDLDNPMRSTIVAIIKTYMEMDEDGKNALMTFAKSLGENLK